MAVADLGYSVYGAVWAYNSGYYFWHMGMYLGRAVSNTIICVDWLLNYSTLQPYWNLALQDYKDAQMEYKEMMEAEREAAEAGEDEEVEEEVEEENDDEYGDYGDDGDYGNEY